MLFWTEEMTKALNEGYSIDFKKVDGYGPHVLRVRMSKDGKTFEAYEDFSTCYDYEDIAYYMDRLIRCVTFNCNLA